MTGELALAAPALGISQHLLNKDHGQAYYSGMPSVPGGAWFLRRHGDEFERLPGGAYRALGRVDDTMNLGGIKVSSGEENIWQRIAFSMCRAIALVIASNQCITKL